MRSLCFLPVIVAVLASSAQAQVFGRTDVGAVVDDPAVPAKPATNPGSWVSTYDYPASALRAEMEGTTRFRLIVGTDGASLQCEVTESSGSPDLDRATCEKLLERARFTPARDGDGKPVVTDWHSAVRWQIPSRGEYQSYPPPAPRPVSFVTSFIVEKDGSVSNCQTERSEGAAPVDPCAFGTVFEPILDDKGNPVRRRVRTTIEVVHEDVPQ